MTAEKWSIESLDLLEFYMKKLRIKLSISILMTRFKKNNTHKQLLKHVQSKKGFLGFTHEIGDLNKKIAKNENFDFSKDYIKEYEDVLLKFLKQIRIH